MPAVRNHSTKQSALHFCDFEGCDKSFARKSDLSRHGLTHRPKSDRPFACEVEGCTVTSNQKSGIVSHHRSVHLRERLSCCEEDCDKTFSDPSSLSRHRSTVHGISFKNRKAAGPSNESRSATKKAASSRSLPYNSGMHRSVALHINQNSKTIQQDMSQFGAFKIDLAPAVPATDECPSDTESSPPRSSQSPSPSSPQSPRDSIHETPSQPFEPSVVVPNEPTTVMSMTFGDLMSELNIFCDKSQIEISQSENSKELTDFALLSGAGSMHFGSGFELPDLKFTVFDREESMFRVNLLEEAPQLSLTGFFVGDACDISVGDFGFMQPDFSHGCIDPTMMLFEPSIVSSIPASSALPCIPPTSYVEQESLFQSNESSEYPTTNALNLESVNNWQSNESLAMAQCQWTPETGLILPQDFDFLNSHTTEPSWSL